MRHRAMPVFPGEGRWMFVVRQAAILSESKATACADNRCNNSYPPFELYGLYLCDAA